MESLPKPQPQFAIRKSKILAQLALPESEYTDASPKGSVDEGIKELIDDLNAVDGLVTTSSCAGRVSVFLEGRKAVSSSEAEAGEGSQLASVGGKGGGGKWLFVSHDPVGIQGDGSGRDWASVLGVGAASETASPPADDEPPRLIHFKFEPMVRTNRVSWHWGTSYRELLISRSDRSSTSSLPQRHMPNWFFVVASKPASAKVELSTWSRVPRSKPLPWWPSGRWVSGSSLS